MKKTWMLCLTGLLAVASAAWSQAQQAGGTEKAVVALEQQWLQGQKTNNPDLVAPLLADKILVTEADGKVLDKDGTLAVYKKTKWDSAECRCAGNGIWRYRHRDRRLQRQGHRCDGKALRCERALDRHVDKDARR